MSQVTACVLLLIVTGLLFATRSKLAERDPGFATRGIWSIQLNQPVQGKILEGLAAEPTVVLAAAAWHAPLAGSLRGISVAAGSSSTRLRAGYNFVSPDYFRLLRIRLTRGRNFTREEAAAEAAVAIVSEATARLLWPGEDPIGRAIMIFPGGRTDRGNKLPDFRVPT